MSQNYQDRIVKGKVIKKGDRECEERYKSIKKFLDKFERPFTVLDLGAAQGYFGFKIAQDFPNSVVVMIESFEGDTLRELCMQNDLPNVIFINKHITPQILEDLSKCEHFDLTLALNIVHHIGDIEKTMNSLIRMGDHLILETPPNEDKSACGQNHISKINEFVEKLNKSKLGESRRHTSEFSSNIYHIPTKKNKLECPYFRCSEHLLSNFNVEIDSDWKRKKIINKRKNTTEDWIPGINLWTYHNLNGEYPERDFVGDELKKIKEEFKDKHKDLNPFNIIMSGKKMTLIDFNDEEHEQQTEDHLSPLIDTYSKIKIFWKGPVFNPTGISTAGRETCKALEKNGCIIQVTDPWRSDFKFNEGLSHWNNAMDVRKGEVYTVFYEYPMYWRDAYGKIVGGFIHEGTKLHPGWADLMNQVPRMWVPTNHVKNMFIWNGVKTPITVIPHGTDPDKYKPAEKEKSDIFTFLYVNAWTGVDKDRKGTDLLIKAFDEEFKNEKDVKLLLKVSCFYDKKPKGFYEMAVRNLLGHLNDNILINEDYVEEDELINYHQNADCFVAPTRGEGFGLTMLNSLACGCPVITTKDTNSGHYDFCKGNPAVIWIQPDGVTRGDPKYFAQDNFFTEPSFEDLKKQMRWAYENRDKLKDMGLNGSEIVRKEWSWDNSAKKMINFLKEKGVPDVKPDGTKW